MKAFKAFIKTFKAPQRSVKIKIEINFFSFRPGLGQEGLLFEMCYRLYILSEKNYIGVAIK